MGHRRHCVCCYCTSCFLLLLHLQKVDIQEEEQEKGQRQGQECHQHDGRQGWYENRGKNILLLLLDWPCSLVVRSCMKYLFPQVLLY